LMPYFPAYISLRPIFPILWRVEMVHRKEAISIATLNVFSGDNYGSFR
jgi:hypothetical protein